MNNNETERTLIEESKNILNKTNSLEGVIKFLRNQTNRKILSAKVVSQLINISISDAMRIVHESSTWSDVKEYHEEFEDTFLSFIEQLDSQ